MYSGRRGRRRYLYLSFQAAAASHSLPLAIAAGISKKTPNSMKADNINDQNFKYVFVCGLQRSGTSILARNIGRLPECAVFRNTGAIEDEGQYLQDVYPTNNELGGTGWYGFNPRAHLTEKSELLTPENIFRLHTSWHRHWDHTKPICVEKTPGNLLMTRFLQAAFPNSYFVVIKRHPGSGEYGESKVEEEHGFIAHGFRALAALLRPL